MLLSISCSGVSTRARISDETKATYQQRCAICHGEAGDGRGDQARMMPVPVPDWSDGSVQSELSDETIRAVITGGGPAAGKSAAMPSHPDLAASAMLDEMVTMIRSFGP